jgi:hypothetical protein
MLLGVSLEYSIEIMHPAVSAWRDLQGCRVLCLWLWFIVTPKTIRSIVCEPSDLRVSATCTPRLGFSVDSAERVGDAGAVL